MNKSKYNFALTVNGEVFTGTGETALEALQAVPRPIKISTKGILNMTHGEHKKQMVIPPMRLKRIMYPNAQKILIRYLAYGLE